MIFAGGRILTMTQPPRAEAVAVKDGRIVAVGGLAECRSAVGSSVDDFDLGGRALVPGFVDAHIHPLMYGQTSSWVDVGPDKAPSIPAMVGLLRVAAAGRPAGQPVRGYGYDLRRLSEGRHPRADELDRVATDRSVQVMHASGHGGIVNSFTLREASISASTPDPAGGEMGRLPDGTPDGRLMDSAWDLLAGAQGVRTGRHGPNIHHHEPTERLLAHLEWAQAEILRAGITTVADAQVTRREMETWLLLRDSGRLRLRVHMYALSSQLEEILDLGLVRPLGDEWLRFAGIKLYSDGTLVGRTAWMPEGYASDSAEHGILYHSPADYRRLVARAHAAGLQTATHALSSAAIGLVLDAVEEAGREVPRDDARHRIEHCALPTEAQVGRMRDLGVVPVAQSQHALLYGDGAIAAVGPEVGGGYHPLGMYERAGVRYALSCDAPVSAPSPLVAIGTAVERRTVLGTQLGGKELSASVESALRAYTIDSAYACHADDRVGSLEPGKWADFAILSADPTAVDPSEIANIRVEETWSAGERVV